MPQVTADPLALARESFLRACWLDVAVRKPGNVSLASPGHGMRAEQFMSSAEAAVGLLLRAGARVGERIDAAGAASWTAAGRCNTNLGILLLCAPLAVAAERCQGSVTPARLQRAVRAVLAELDVADAVAAYRAIARASPGGLGRAEAQDVAQAPTVTLREAMVLAAARDRIAAQYANGFAELFNLLPLLPPGLLPLAADGTAPPATTAAVQRVYLAVLARQADSHIVRKRGEALAQTVMHAAQGWFARARVGARLNGDPAFIAWDDALKQQRLNPGTSADFTVAALFVAGLLKPA